MTLVQHTNQERATVEAGFKHHHDGGNANAQILLWIGRWAITMTRAGNVLLNSVSRQFPTAMKHRDANASTWATDTVCTWHVSNNIDGCGLRNCLQTTHEARWIQLESQSRKNPTSPEQDRKVFVLGEKKVVSIVDAMITKNETRHNFAPVLVEVVAPYRWNDTPTHTPTNE